MQKKSLSRNRIEFSEEEDNLLCSTRRKDKRSRKGNDNRTDLGFSRGRGCVPNGAG